MPVFKYAKTDKIAVGKHFSSHEFVCHCHHCDLVLIDSDLVDLLDKLRDLLGAKIVISSGYRCDYMQALLKAQGFETADGISQHQLGKAADIRSDSRSGADLEIFATEAGFKGIGVAKDWIHVDTRTDKVRRWAYKK